MYIMESKLIERFGHVGVTSETFSSSTSTHVDVTVMNINEKTFTHIESSAYENSYMMKSPLYHARISLVIIDVSITTLPIFRTPPPWSGVQKFANTDKQRKETKSL